jgi:hypothetical protein
MTIGMDFCGKHDCIHGENMLVGNMPKRLEHIAPIDEGKARITRECMVQKGHIRTWKSPSSLTKCLTL